MAERKTSGSADWLALTAKMQAAGVALPPLPSFSLVCRDDGPWFTELGYTYWNCELLDALYRRLAAEGVSGPGFWLEVAAGTGRWAAELNRRGLDAVATDDFSQSPERTGSHQRPVRYGPWVLNCSARDAVARYRPVGLLCAWPPLGSCLVPDLLLRSVPGSETLQLLVCIGDPTGATEAPVHPHEIPPGWRLETWPECQRYLVGFNDPLPASPGFRSNSVLLVYRWG